MKLSSRLQRLGKAKTLEQKSKASRRAALIFCIVMVIWPILNWLLVFVYANIENILFTFQRYQYDSVAGKGTFVYLPFNDLFKNYKDVIVDMFADPNVGTYIVRGIGMYIPITFIAMPFLYLFPFIIYRKLPLYRTFRILLYLPNILSSMVVMMFFKYFADRGLPDIMSKVFQVVDFPMILSDPEYTVGTMTAYSIFMGMTGNVVLTVNMYNRIPPELYESGQIDGLSMGGEFLHIAIPMLYPMVTIGLYGIIIASITYEGPFFALYGDSAPSHVRTYGYYILTSVIGRNSSAAKFPYTTAQAVFMGLMSYPIVRATRWVFEKFDPNVEF